MELWITLEGSTKYLYFAGNWRFFVLFPISQFTLNPIVYLEPKNCAPFFRKLNTAYPAFPSFPTPPSLRMYILSSFLLLPASLILRLPKVSCEHRYARFGISFKTIGRTCVGVLHGESQKNRH